MRFFPLVLVGLASCNPESKTEHNPVVPEAASFTAEKAKELIPEAAGMPLAELQKLGLDPSIDKHKPSQGDSLTWWAVTYMPDPNITAPTSFRFLGEFVNPSKFANALTGPKNRDGKHRQYASLIHPEYITDCTAKVDGDTATGTVTFGVKDTYEGKAEYTARKKDGGWRIEEFRLPDHKLTVALGVGGKWVKK